MSFIFHWSMGYFRAHFLTLKILFLAVFLKKSLISILMHFGQKTHIGISIHWHLLKFALGYRVFLQRLTGMYLLVRILRFQLYLSVNFNSMSLLLCFFKSVSCNLPQSFYLYFILIYQFFIPFSCPFQQEKLIRSSFLRYCNILSEIKA